MCGIYHKYINTNLKYDKSKERNVDNKCDRSVKLYVSCESCHRARHRL